LPRGRSQTSMESSAGRTKLQESRFSYLTLRRE
jgi:hypothetical protein